MTSPYSIWDVSFSTTDIDGNRHYIGEWKGSLREMPKGLLLPEECGTKLPARTLEPRELAQRIRWILAERMNRADAITWEETKRIAVLLAMGAAMETYPSGSVSASWE